MMDENPLILNPRMLCGITLLSLLPAKTHFRTWLTKIQQSDWLKYILKIYALKLEILAVTRPCIRFFSFDQIAFQSSD